MREQDAVILAYLPVTFLLYVLFSGRYLSILFGREPPQALRATIQKAFRDPLPSFRKALGAYVGWTAILQLPPVLFALSNSPAFLREASVVEIAAAIAWTIYLRTHSAP
jgi:hypothetical protein